MINKIYKCVGVAIGVAILFACNKNVLDVKNLSAIDPALAWSDPVVAESYLANLYNRIMPGGWPARSGVLFGGLAVDDYRGGAINETTIQISNHPWSGSGPGSFEDSYTDIRQVNILLQEIDKGTLEEAIRNKIKGQAFFLRAYSYFLLLRVYGGVPLLLEPQNIDDDLKVTRASSAEIFGAIAGDLDQSITLLAGQKFADNDKGKIGLAAALAFKGRVALYKASPLFNPQKPYDNNFWQEAYTSNLDAKTQLETMGFGLNESYEGIWSVSNEGNKEAVLTVKFTAPAKVDGRREQGARPGSQTANDAGADNPVWSLLKAYPMKDGYPAGASPNYNYSDQTFWQNRDPRFEATIVYNGSLYETGGVKGRRQYTDDKLATSDDAYTTDPQARSGTGLYTRKGMQPDLTRAEVAQNAVDWIEIRYAEVLLNLAEAANETGRTPEAIDILKRIRQRAGIEPGNGNYGLTEASREGVRTAIFNERRIEFVFEGQRFWDLKRSRRLTDFTGFVVEGLASTLKASNLPVDQAKKDNYQYLPEDFIYTPGPILKATSAAILFSVPEKYYFAPIPVGQIQKNPNLKQNVDWGGDFNPTLE